jgi:hypothetical protein
MTSRLPEAAREALQKIPAASEDDKSDLAGIALEAVAFPRAKEGVPVASQLTDAQRTVATELAKMRDVWLGGWAMPQPSWARLRWLGLSPPGVLDLPKNAPLWKKLNDTRKGNDAIDPAKLDLPLLDRLEAYGDIACGGHKGLFAVWSSFDELRGPEVGAWAKRQAERVSAALASHDNDKLVNLPRSFSLTIVLGLARGGVPFEESWSAIVRPFEDPLKLRIEAFKGISEPLRSKIFAERLTQNVFSGAAVSGLELLTHFPSGILASAILAKSDRASWSKAKIVAAVAEVAKKSDAVQVVLDKFKGRQPKPLTLSLTRTTSPKRLADLKGVRLAQVRAVLPEGEDPAKSGLMIRELADAKTKPAYDAVSFNADDGLVFAAGTTDVVAELVQHEVQCDNERLHDALREVLCFGGAKPAKKKPAKKKR